MSPNLEGYLTPLHLINKEIGYWDRGGKVHVPNEITYSDQAGVMQFLRRTLLAGAQKFNKRFSQTLPQKMLDIFCSHINYVRRLYVIGYSFGDAHIDLILRNWLEFSGDRFMVIVNPHRKVIPPHFAHLAPQIEITQQTAGQFFVQYRREPMTPFQMATIAARAMRRPGFEKRAAKKW